MRSISRSLAWSLLFCFLCVTSTLAATVTGTVTNSSGLADARVYVQAQRMGWGEANLGVSVPAGATSFTIRGLEDDGDYVFRAFMDVTGTGTPHLTDPVGESATVTINGGVITGIANINLDVIGQQIPLAVNTADVLVAPGDGMVFLHWETPRNEMDILAADHYRLEWSGDNFSTILDSKTFVAEGDAPVFVDGLTNDTDYQFRIVSIAGGTEVTTTIPVTVGVPAEGVAIEGTVTLNNNITLAQGAPLYVLAISETSPSRVVKIAAPTAGSNSFTIWGVDAGQYEIIALLDQNNNGILDDGDLDNGDQAAVVTVAASSVTGVVTALDGSAALVAVGTSHYLDKLGLNHSYSLNCNVRSNSKRVVNVYITGPQLSSEGVDLAARSWDEFSLWQNVASRPLVATDVYTFTVEYADGSETVYRPVTAVLDNPPTPLTPADGATNVANSGFTFDWDAPASGPAAANYSVRLNSTTGQFWWDNWDLPGSATSTGYTGTDLANGSYTWSVNLRDALGNEVGYQPGNLFTVTSGGGIASGTYTYDSASGTLSFDWINTTFVCEGPELGADTQKTITTLSATTLTWTEWTDGTDTMTWTRAGGTAGDIVGTWSSTDGTTGNSWTLTFNADGTVSVTGTIYLCGGGGGGGGTNPPIAQVVNNTGGSLYQVDVGNAAFTENLGNCGNGCSTGFPNVTSGSNQIVVYQTLISAPVSVGSLGSFATGNSYAVNIRNVGGYCAELWQRFDTSSTFNDDSTKMLIATTCGGGTGDTQAPTVPTGVTATAVNANRVDVAWNISTDNVGVTYYQVYRNGQPAGAPAGPTNNFWPDTFVIANTTYNYTVAACDVAGNCSAQSSPASVTTPDTSSSVVSQFDGTYTGSWSKTCPTCGVTASTGTFTATLANGVFTDISLPITSGDSGIRFDTGAVSSSGAITGTGATPSQCSSSVSTFTGQITTTSSGDAAMTMSYSRLASPEGCAAESGTITATRLPGLVALWHFDEGTGTVAADVTGVNNGTLFNAPVWVQGKSLTALDFNGSTQYVNVKAGPILGSAPNFTIEAWIKWDGATTAHALQMIYSEGHYNDIIDLMLEDGVPMFNTLGDNWRNAKALTQIPAGEWHHLSAVLEAGVGGKLYVDGQLAASNPLMGAGSQYAGETDIGGFAGNGGSRYFSGAIDEVLVFNTARSASEILADYQSGNPTSGTWNTKNPMPAARHSAAAGVINDILYVAGGSDGTSQTPTLQAYDPAANTWNTLAAMPAGRYGGNGADVINGKLYVAGGWDNTYTWLPHQELFEYDPATDSWSTKASMPTLSGCGATGAINGKLYVTTACNGYSGYRNLLHVYDPTADTWSGLPSSPVAHSNPAFGVINGRFYVAGGYDGAGNPTAQLDEFDPATNTWSTRASMPIQGGGFASGVANGKLYVAGGQIGSQYFDSVYVYDPATNIWATAASMPTPRGSAAAGVINGVLYVAGGYNANGTLATVEAYALGGTGDSTPPTTYASPPGGSYTSPQTVTLTASEPATIYYTTDGSDPLTSPTKLTYSDPILISATTTLKFYALDAAGNSEEVQTHLYTINGGSGTPNIAVTPSSVSFGDIPVGQSSPGQLVTISNTGSADLSINSWWFQGYPDAFGIGAGDETSCPPPPTTLLPGGGCTLALAFAPQYLGTFYAQLAISTNDPDTGMAYVSLDGTGGFPTTPASVTYVFPPQGATGISPVGGIFAGFDQPMDLASVTTQNFRLLASDGSPVPGNATYDGKRAIFWPSSPLAPGTYTAELTTGVLNAGGIPLAAPVSWSFAVVALDDTFRSALEGGGIFSPEERWNPAEPPSYSIMRLIGNLLSETSRDFNAATGQWETYAGPGDEQYLLTPQGWTLVVDGPEDGTVTFNADGTFTYANAANGEQLRVSVAEYDPSGQPVTGYFDPASISVSPGTIFPAGSRAYGLAFERLADRYRVSRWYDGTSTVDSNYVRYWEGDIEQVVTDLDQLTAIFAAGSQQRIGISMDTEIQFGADGTLPIYRFGQLVHTGSWESRTVSGLTLIVTSIPPQYMEDHDPGSERFFAVVDGLVKQGEWEIAGTTSLDDVLSFNETAFNGILSGFQPGYPMALITGAPASVTTANDATINVGGAGVVFYRYSLDGAPFSDVSFTEYSLYLSGLEDGAHTLAVIAGDAAGQWQPEGAATVVSWTVDTAPPTAALTGAPTGTTSSASAEITVGGTGVVAYKYRLNGGAWSVETSVATKISLTLSDGPQTLGVVGRDAVGNWQVAPTSASWTVESGPSPSLDLGTASAVRGGIVSIPITLTNVAGKSLASVSIDISFDTNILENPVAIIGPAGSASGKGVSSNVVAPGLLRVAVAGINATPIANGVVATVSFTVKPSAPTGVTVLGNVPSGSDQSGNTLSVTGGAGSVNVITKPGDCNGDGAVSIAEVQSAINMHLGLKEESACVDVDGSGAVSIGEVQKSINSHLGL